MTIIQRLVMTLAVALLGLLVVGGSALWQLHQAQTRFEEVQTNTFPSIKALDEARALLTRTRIATYQHALHTEKSEKERLEKTMSEVDGLFDQALATYERDLITDDKDRQLLAEDRAMMAAYRETRKQLLAKSNANDMEGARHLLTNDLLQKTAALSKALVAHVDYNYELGEKLRLQNAANYSSAIIMALVLSGVVFVIVGLLGMQLLSVIRGGLRDMQGTMTHISNTLDFTARVRVNGQDEISQTGRAFNGLLDRMSESLRSLTERARDVAGVAQQMSSSAQQVSNAASAQSEASSAVAATVEELTVSINSVAERTGDAQHKVKHSAELAEAGSATISQTISDVHEISMAVRSAAESIRQLEEQSNQVGHIVQVIKDVADQTNLLALNAAIEAARAGEQGRGFAVVADEVRKLAERTTTSTQEISSTILAMNQGSQQAVAQVLAVEERVNSSVTRAGDTDQAMKNISQSAADTLVTVEEITLAAYEQGKASNDIAQKIEQIAQMACEASAAANQSADSASRLDQQASLQLETLRQYKL